MVTLYLRHCAVTKAQNILQTLLKYLEHLNSFIDKKLTKTCQMIPGLYVLGSIVNFLRKIDGMV